MDITLFGVLLVFDIKDGEEVVHERTIRVIQFDHDWGALVLYSDDRDDFGVPGQLQWVSLNRVRIR